MLMFTECSLVICVLLVYAHSLSHVQLFVTLETSLPGSSVHGISQARILEQIDIFYSRISSEPRDWTCIPCVSCIGMWSFYLGSSPAICLCEVFPSYTAAAAAAPKPLSFQSCLTLCDPIDGNPPRLPHPWDSPGKNTGVGCHFHLTLTTTK